MFVDINECKTEDGNMCHSLSQCENTPGSYDCYCTVDGDRFKCTGSCVWRGKLILHGISYVNNNCKLCQCNVSRHFAEIFIHPQISEYFHQLLYYLEVTKFNGY